MSTKKIQKVRPAETEAGDEQQMIALAKDLAKKKFMDGSAGQSLIVHYLKLASETEQLTRMKLQEETRLLSAKTEALRNAASTDSLYKEALRAMRSYSGDISDDEDV
jgi:hypothetical protein